MRLLYARVHSQNLTTISSFDRRTLQRQNFGAYLSHPYVSCQNRSETFVSFRRLIIYKTKAFSIKKKRLYSLVHKERQTNRRHPLLDLKTCVSPKGGRPSPLRLPPRHFLLPFLFLWRRVPPRRIFGEHELTSGGRNVRPVPLCSSAAIVPRQGPRLFPRRPMSAPSTNP